MSELDTSNSTSNFNKDESKQSSHGVLSTPDAPVKSDVTAGASIDTVSANNNTANVTSMSKKEKRAANRRIIAENPEWNLAPVERLSDLSVKVIVTNFESKTKTLSSI